MAKQPEQRFQRGADLVRALRRAVDVWRVRSVVGARVTRLEEPGYLEMRKLAGPYMPNEAHELLFVNVAKIVDFARGGADGVVNAICFGCMMGTASAAIIEKIRRFATDLVVCVSLSGRKFQELEKRAAAEPREPRWAVMLAEIELAVDANDTTQVAAWQDSTIALELMTELPGALSSAPRGTCRSPPATGSRSPRRGRARAIS